MIFHVAPVNDTGIHRDFTFYSAEGKLRSRCSCDARIEETTPEGTPHSERNFIVIHNSFDGREGVEIANEILGLKTSYSRALAQLLHTIVFKH